MTAAAEAMRAAAPQRHHRALPAAFLYGRLLATAVQHFLGGRAAPPGALRHEDGAIESLPVSRWLAPADAADAVALERVAAPVLDIGCGPGRHLAALRADGKVGLGVDLSPVAVSIAQGRGADAMLGSVFGDVAGAGGWRTALLLDGNIGIGGAPDVLLRRARDLLAPGGSVVVELDPPGAPTRRTRVRLEALGVVSEWFAWASVGVDGVPTVAARAGLVAAETFAAGDRWFGRILRR